MSGREFFTSRYEQLGWQYQEVTLKQAIRINNTNSKGKKLIARLADIGVHLQKISFLDSGYWVLDSKVSAGATAEYLLGMYSIQEAAAQIPVSVFTHLKGKLGFVRLLPELNTFQVGIQFRKQPHKSQFPYSHI